MHKVAAGSFRRNKDNSPNDNNPQGSNGIETTNSHEFEDDQYMDPSKQHDASASIQEVTPKAECDIEPAEGNNNNNSQIRSESANNTLQSQYEVGQKPANGLKRLVYRTKRFFRGVISYRKGELRNYP